MTASEAIRYNEGFEAAMKIAKNAIVIDGPDIEIDGELVIKGPKRRVNLEEIYSKKTINKFKNNFNNKK